MKSLQFAAVRRVIAVIAIFAAPVAAQMTPNEALDRLRERESTATTQPDDLSEMKQVIRDLRMDNIRLANQVAGFNRRVPQAPQVGWNLVRLKEATYAKVCNTNCVFDVTADGTLALGTPGRRVKVVTELAGIPNNLQDGSVVNTATHQIHRLPQLALYNSIHQQQHAVRPRARCPGEYPPNDRCLSPAGQRRFRLHRTRGKK